MRTGVSCFENGAENGDGVTIKVQELFRAHLHMKNNLPTTIRRTFVEEEFIISI